MSAKLIGEILSESKAEGTMRLVLLTLAYYASDIGTSCYPSIERLTRGGGERRISCYHACFFGSGFWHSVGLRVGMCLTSLDAEQAKKKLEEQTMNHGTTDTRIPTSVIPANGAEVMCSNAGSICQFTLELNREAFSPMYFPRGMKCKLILTGVCHVVYPHVVNAQPRGIDALYQEGDPGNFIARHTNLLIDMKQFRADPLEDDRAQHQYMLPYTGTGGRLAVLLRTPTEWLANHYTRQLTGAIEVTVASLTSAELAACGLGAEERQREEEREEYVHRVALQLAARAHMETNFLDQGYRERYAAKYLSKILDEYKYDWRDLYLKVLGDAALYSLVQVEHPHVMEWLEALLETVRVAERLALESDPERKPRLTPEEKEAKFQWKRQQILDQLRVHAEDEIAKKLQRFELAEKLRSKAQQMNLDEDDIERLVQELMGDLQDDEDEQNTGFKQL